jgi:CAAX protease family protein
VSDTLAPATEGVEAPATRTATVTAPPPPPLPPAPPVTGEAPVPEPPLTGVVVGPWSAVAFAALMIGLNLGLQALAGSTWLQQGLRSLVVSVAGSSVPERELIVALLAGAVSLLAYALMLAPAIAIARRRGVSFGEAFGLRDFRARQAVGGALLLIVGGIFATAYYTTWLRGFGIEAPGNTTRLVEGFGTGPIAMVVGFLLVGVVAPFVEEVAFRGVVFAGLRGRFGTAWAAVASGALFGIVHLQPLETVPLALIGVALAWIFSRSRSLWPAIIAHGAYNVVVLAIALALAPLVR